MKDGWRAKQGGSWKGLRWLPLLAGSWILVAALDVSRLLVFPPYREHWQAVVLWRFPAWMPWTLFTLLLWWLSNRFPLEKPRRLRAAVVHVAAALAVLVLHSLVSASLLLEFMPTEGTDIPSMGLAQAAVLIVIMEGPVVVVLYGAILGILHGIRYDRRLRRQEVTASRLETQLAQARLDNLRMQLHPHFLFNSLNAVATLVRKGARTKAVEILAGLSDLLRQALAKSSRSWVTLEEELELVGKYLALEQVRFKDRLRVEREIEAEAAQAMVPTLILQPLVENAVRHGIAGRRSAGRIEIKAWAEEGLEQQGRLVLEVLDDGPGPPDQSPGDGRLAAEGPGSIPSERESLSSSGVDSEAAGSRVFSDGAVGRTLSGRNLAANKRSQGRWAGDGLDEEEPSSDMGAGVGLDAGDRGLGLFNTRARLSELFGSRAGLELRPRRPSGAVARIEMPLCREVPQ